MDQAGKLDKGKLKGYLEQMHQELETDDTPGWVLRHLHNAVVRGDFDA